MNDLHLQKNISHLYFYKMANELSILSYMPTKVIHEYFSLIINK